MNFSFVNILKLIAKNYNLQIEYCCVKYFVDKVI